MHDLDLDPTVLSGPALAQLYNSHYQALRASRIVWEKSVAMAMGRDNPSNHAGFSEWAVENMEAVESWRASPALRRTYNILHTEVHRRWGKDQAND